MKVSLLYVKEWLMPPIGQAVEVVKTIKHVEDGRRWVLPLKSNLNYISIYEIMERCALDWWTELKLSRGKEWFLFLPFSRAAAND
jgi:hypothetical protein